jgi:hypothetical protein
MAEYGLQLSLRQQNSFTEKLEASPKANTTPDRHSQCLRHRMTSVVRACLSLKRALGRLLWRWGVPWRCQGDWPLLP